MIFHACYIENYGLLRNLHLSFQKGMNGILSDNGSGKSTFASFLLAMLYGLPASTKQDPGENERRHYTPWQGGRFGGSLTFSVGERRYRVVRYFGEKESTDTFALYDADTEQESRDYSAALGEELFHVDRDAFLKSAFCSANEKNAFTGKNMSVTARLSRYVESSSDAVPYEEALNILEKQRKLYIKVGNRGLIPETESEIAAEKQACRLAEQDARTAAELAGTIAKLKDRLATVEKAEEENAARLIEVGKQDVTDKLRRHGNSLREEAEKLSRQAEDERRSFGLSIPSEKEITAAEEAAIALFHLRSRIEEPVLSPAEMKEMQELQELFGECPPDEDRLSAMAENGGIGESSGDKNLFLPEQRHRGFLLPATGFAGIVAGIVTLGTAVIAPWSPGYLLGGIFAAAGGILFLYTGILRRRRRQQSAEKKRESRQKRYLSLSLKGENYRRLLQKKAAAEKERDRFREEYRNGYDRLSRFVAAAGESGGDLREQLASLRKRQENYNALLQRKQDAEKARDRFFRENPGLDQPPEQETPSTSYPASRENSGTALVDTAIPAVSSSDLTMQKEGLRREKERLKQEIEEVTRRRLPLWQNGQKLPEKESRIGELTAKVKEYNRHYQAILGAEKWLTKAKENMSMRYLSDMQAAFDRYLHCFLPDCDSRGVLNSDLSLKMENGGMRYVPGYYSNGTRDVLSFCMHMALFDALFTEERPPLLLDDPFVAADDKRLRLSMDFLHTLAEKQQIFYFTCQASRQAENSIFLPQTGKA